MNGREILRYIFVFLMTAPFGWIIGIILRFSFNLEFWVEPLFVILGLFMGLFILKKSKEIPTVLYSPIRKESALRLSKIYNAVAAIVFFFPFAIFSYNILIGEYNFAPLILSILLLFYLSQFIDYQTIIKPVTIEANIFTIVYLLFSIIQLTIISGLYSVSFLTVSNVNALAMGITALTVFGHGIWIRSMHRAAGQKLAETHPKLYYDEMPYRGLYNTIIGASLGGTLYVNFLLSPRSFVEIIASLLAIALVIFIMAPYVSEFHERIKYMRAIRTQHKYHKILIRIRKDKWEDEVLTASLLIRFLNAIVWAILSFSTLVGLFAVYYSVFQGSLENLIPILVLFSLVFTTVHYRLTTRGERILTFLTIFQGKPLSSDEIRRYTELALGLYGISGGMLLGAIQIKLIGLERILLVVRNFEITNVALLMIFFVFTFIVIAFLSTYLYAQSDDVDVDKRNRRALQVLILLIGLTMIISINVVFYAFLSLVAAAVFSSLAVFLLVLLFLKATRDLRLVKKN